MKQRFPWVLLVIGLLAGAGGGVYYAWFLNPVTYADIAPNLLSDQDRETYILLVSEAYLQDRDLSRARERLAALGESDLAALVSVQADAAYLSGAEDREVRALTTLAEALGGQPAALEVFSGTAPPPPVTPSPNPTATPTAALAATPLPTATPFQPSPTVPQARTFELLERDSTCSTDSAGRIEVVVLGEGGEGLPGISVLVRWEDGEDRFFTGLQPDQGPGFADFITMPDLLYSVELAGLSEPVVGISSFACTTDDNEIGEPVHRFTFAPN